MNKRVFKKSESIKGWTFSKPSAKEAVKIKKKAEAMRSGKAKSIPLSDIIHKLEKTLVEAIYEHAPPKFRKSTPEEHREIMERVNRIKSGKLKEVRMRPIPNPAIEKIRSMEIQENRATYGKRKR